MGAAAAPPKKPALTQDKINVVMPKPAIPTGTGSAIESTPPEGCAALAGALKGSETS